jgi:nucleotide-binding universal stress UspA family protein
MRNPLRSEAEAFRFLLLTIGYFALIVIGAMINTWVGVAVFVRLTLLALYVAFFRGQPEPLPRTAPTVPSPEGEARILVIANETIGGKALTDLIHQKSEGSRANVLVVAPAMVSPLQTLTSDEDPGRAAAQERLEATVAKLRSHGVEANGKVGDAQPLQAIEDALRTFGADEIIISTHPEGRSRWLEIGVVNGARARFAVPITHVVVDLDAE